MKNLDGQYLRRIRSVLKEALVTEKGIVGFSNLRLNSLLSFRNQILFSLLASKIEPDSDNTAKALAALNFLGEHFPIESLLKHFELETHFACFQQERNPSFTANCNVLITLLHTPVRIHYIDQIRKAATFICNQWWKNEGILTETWVCFP